MAGSSVSSMAVGGDRNAVKMNVVAKSGEGLKNVSTKNKKSIAKSKEDSKLKNTIQDVVKKKMESDKKKSPAESRTGKKINILT